MRQTHIAGERLFVDFAGRTGEVVDGRTGEVVDGRTGEIITVQIFVGLHGVRGEAPSEGGGRPLNLGSMCSSPRSS